MTEPSAPAYRPGGPPWRRWLATPPAVARLPWLSSGVVLLIQLVGSTFASQSQEQTGQADHRITLDVFGYALLVLGPALLVLRHRHPPLAAFGTAVTAAVYLGAGYPYGPVFLSVGVGAFGAVVTGHRYAAWGALGLFWLSRLLVGHWLYEWLPPGDDGPEAWAADAATASLAIALLAVSELLRVRREQLARARSEREAAERRRADEERLRIARELHDVLAHSISVINVQAGVGLALLDSDPDQARTALTTIKSASKEALGEVRQVLDTLRSPGGAAPRAPAPGLARLPELAVQAADAGLTVETRTEGAPSPLPPGADLAAFRIVQEALTNTVRHSGSRTARVRLRYAADELQLQIDDDGPATGEGTVGGNGLVGMRERAAAFGGTVTAGPRDDGGFRVTARLPLTRPQQTQETGQTGQTTGTTDDNGETS
jgi:signal transduction histidine kinase